METKKIKMNADLRNQLTGLLPMDNDAQYSFTPEIFDDIPEEYQPIFNIKQLTNEQIILVKGMLYDDAMNMDKKKTKSKLQAELKRKSAEYIDILNEVVVGWDNLFKIVNGDELEAIKYSKDSVKNLPEIIRSELFAKAIEISGFLPKGVI